MDLSFINHRLDGARESLENDTQLLVEQWECSMLILLRLSILV